MKSFIFALLAFGLTTTVQADDCTSAECALKSYMEAHITKDVHTMYNLTAKSERGERNAFMANYHRKHVVPDVFQEFVEQHTHFELTTIEEQNDFARVRADTEYPDFRTPALERGREGITLDTPEDWADLVGYLQSEGFESISDQEELYLIKEDGGWRVLTPTLH